MVKHISTLIISLILIVSCNQKHDKKEISELKIEKEVIFQESDTLKQYIENDSLLALLTFDLNKIALNTKFNLTIKPQKNPHNNTVIDTIKTLVYCDSKITIYKATNWESIYEAEIRNSNFTFLNSVKIGMDKYNLEKALGIPLESDLINVGNLEQTSVFVFILNNGVLKEIYYEGYVD